MSKIQHNAWRSRGGSAGWAHAGDRRARECGSLPFLRCGQADTCSCCCSFASRTPWLLSPVVLTLLFIPFVGVMTESLPILQLWLMASPTLSPPHGRVAPGSLTCDWLKCCDTLSSLVPKDRRLLQIHLMATLWESGVRRWAYLVCYW